MDITIAAIQAAFANGPSENKELQKEAKAILRVPALRKEMLENHGVDTTGLSEQEIYDLLISHSND